MSVFYEITPVDTLFFRGSTPMGAGQNTVVSLFPPPVSVFEGAIRTAVLLQQGIDIEKYVSKEDSSVNSLIGNPGEKASFEITAIMIKKGGDYYVPVPTTWYLDSKNKPKSKEDYIGREIIIASNMKAEFDSMFIQGSGDYVAFSRGNNGLQPMGNIWISMDFLKSSEKELSEKDFLFESGIYSMEQRTGVALDSNKHTIEGQLYSSAHIRLLDDVSLIVGISKDVGLEKSGKLYLGGEKRLSCYKILDNDLLEGFSSSTQYLSLVPIEATKENLANLVASAKLTVVAGWDLAKGFHKPTTSWIPAGAVFNKEIKGCVPLAQKGE